MGSNSSRVARGMRVGREMAGGGVWAVAAGLVWALGCTPPSTLALDHQPLPLKGLSVSGAAAVAVHDTRPDVESGAKPACYLGSYFTKVGETGELRTGAACEPLAALVQRDLEEELRNLGYELGPGGIQMDVTLQEWEFDGFHSGLVSYQVAVVVKDAKGAVIAEDTVRDANVVPDGHTHRSMQAAGQFLPILYDRMVDALLRENQTVMRALL